MSNQSSLVVERRPSGEGRRLPFLDAIRVGIIVMVIVHHAAQAYGPTGGAWPVTDPANSDWFRPFYTVNASIGLGLLFLVAGYLVPKSYDRKGSTSFLKERWMRIGIPLLVFALLVHLPLVYLFLSRPPLDDFIGALYESGWQGIYLHLWFLGHLLLYSAVYVIWRRFADRAGRPLRVLPPPTNVVIAGFVVALALGTWIIRWSYPIDEWVPLFFLIPAEPANLLQYVSLFTIGVIACRSDWFRQIPRRVGMIWLTVGLAAVATIYTVEALGRFDDLLATGGLSLRALTMTTLSALICAGLSAGLVVLARELIRRPFRLLALMASASYAAYILHLWIASGLQAGLLGIDLPVFVKFGLATLLGVAISFGVGHLSGKVPGLRTILGTAPHRSQ